jgi:hypothetical protein
MKNRIDPERSIAVCRALCQFSMKQELLIIHMIARGHSVQWKQSFFRLQLPPIRGVHERAAKPQRFAKKSTVPVHSAHIKGLGFQCIQFSENLI